MRFVTIVVFVVSELAMLHLDRDLQERLLGRPVRDVLTPADRRAFRGQRVLVTGAGETPCDRRA